MFWTDFSPEIKSEVNYYVPEWLVGSSHDLQTRTNHKHFWVLSLYGPHNL